MATVDENVTSTISDHAIHMLGCFVAGLDTLMYQIAEQTARDRAGDGPHTGPVAIEAQDVQRAAEFLARRIKELVKDGHLPPGADAEIDRMVQCCRRQAALAAEMEPR